TYDLARRALRHAEYTSDLSECELVKRIPKRLPAYSPNVCNQQKKQRFTKNKQNLCSHPPAIPPCPPTPKIYFQEKDMVPSTSGTMSSLILANDSSIPEYTFQLLNQELEPHDDAVEKSLPQDQDTSEENCTSERSNNASTPSLSFERFVVEEIIAIKSMLSEMGGKLDVVAVAENGNEKTVEFDDDEFVTASSIDALQLISSKSLQVKEYRQKLIQHLSAVGGTKCTKVLNRMLKELMTDDVAMNYSFKGQREKLSFEALGLTSVLAACLKQNPFTRKERSVFNIEAGIMSWLKRAPVRIAKKGTYV
ncbi:unnamed protein product, partial [Allacma fusca]